MPFPIEDEEEFDPEFHECCDHCYCKMHKDGWGFMQKDGSIWCFTCHSENPENGQIG